MKVEDICEEATPDKGGIVAELRDPTGLKVLDHHQYCWQKPEQIDGKSMCPLYHFEIVPFAGGCACLLSDYKKVKT